MPYDDMLAFEDMGNDLDKTAAAVSVPDPLKKNLEWYISNQRDLAAKYNGKVLLIVDQKLVEAFDTMAAAYAASKKYTPGIFTLQPCSPDPESYTLILSSPAFSVFP